MAIYADIIVPLAFRDTLTYALQEGGSVEPGCRVEVSIGRKNYIGVVMSLHDRKPERGTVRSINKVVDSVALVGRSELEMWQWIAEYYMCPLGEVMRAALPLEIRTNTYRAQTCLWLRMTSKARMDPHRALDDLVRAPVQRKALLAFLEEMLTDIFDHKTPDDMEPRPVKQLEKELLRFASCEDSRVILPDNEVSGQDFLCEELLTRGDKASRQLPDGEKSELCVRYSDKLLAQEDAKSIQLHDNKDIGLSVMREKLLARDGVTPLAIRELVRRGILESFEMPCALQAHDKMPELHKRELEATWLFQTVTQTHETHDNVLLYEPRMADKTGLYLLMARECIARGEQMLILMPDQHSVGAMTERLQEVLSRRVEQYHSGVSDHARSRIFCSIESYSVVVGTRSALFLPFRKLRYVVVDTEHDALHKSTDAQPRYNARDVAMMLGAKSGAKVLMTSEAPSVESYYNATRGVWKLCVAENDERSGGRPNFTVLERGRELLSQFLRGEIRRVLDRGQQAVVFQNRRGYSIYVECANCMEIPTCHQCNVSLTYHRSDNTLRCHYCGYRMPYSEVCPSCSSVAMQLQGRGTQRIEDSLVGMFPEAQIERLDYDTTRASGEFERIAHDFASAKSDIIVGTQMVLRGVDFSGVGVVGIVNADNLLCSSDFRASERAFQQLTYLANRAGCGENSRVVIQTTQRLHPVIRAVEQGDFNGFYRAELEQRRELNYPPFVRLIAMKIRHADKGELVVIASRIEQLLRPVFGQRLSPPFEPVVDKTFGEHILEFYLRIERERSTVRAKEILAAAVATIRAEYRSIRVVVDVDPV